MKSAEPRGGRRGGSAIGGAGPKERAEAERLRKEQEAAEARRAAEERDRASRDDVKAREEQYRSLILSADEALAQGLPECA